MSESNDGGSSRPFPLPTDAAILDPRMTTDIPERTHLKPSSELLRLTEKQAKRAKAKYEQAVEKYPLLSDKLNDIYRMHGSMVILQHALYAPLGLMYTAERAEQPTEDLNEQTRVSLFTGAAREMAGWVLGYPESADTPPEDEKLWSDRFEIEEKYFHGLFEARKEIPNKKFIRYEGETMHMVLFLEFAESMKAKEREVYINREADERARYNLGIADSEIYDEEFLKDWTRVEKTYIEDALKRHGASHGRKDITTFE